MMSDDLLTTGQIADLAGVDRSAVHYWARDGKLTPALTTGTGIRLFRRDEVEAFLADRKAAAK